MEEEGLLLEGVEEEEGLLLKGLEVEVEEGPPLIGLEVEEEEEVGTYLLMMMGQEVLLLVT